VFCETGKERIVKLLCEKILGVRAVLLTTVNYKFYRGKHREITNRVLPSYLFIYLRDDIDIYRIAQISHVFRVLSLSGEYELHERDLKFAKWVYETGGIIKTSRVYREGDHVVVVDGPLKDYERDIVWVDKRKGKAKVSIQTESLDIGIWLSFEYVSDYQPNQLLG